MCFGEISPARGEALVLWDEARSVWEQGNTERAEELLRESFARHPSSRAACDLGRILREGGRRSEAIEWFDRCADQADVHSEERENALAEARALRDRQGRLHITGGVEGAAIFIDDEFFRRAPLDEEVGLTPGPHELLIVDRDGVSTRRTVEVRPAMVTDFVIPTTDESTSDHSSPARRVPRWSVWMMAAITLAAVVGASVTYALDFQASSEHGAEDRATTMRLISGVLGGVAGASLGVTLVLIPFALRPRHGERNEREESGLSWNWRLGSSRGSWW